MFKHRKIPSNNNSGGGGASSSQQQRTSYNGNVSRQQQQQQQQLLLHHHHPAGHESSGVAQVHHTPSPVRNQGSSHHRWSAGHYPDSSSGSTPATSPQQTSGFSPTIPPSSPFHYLQQHAMQGSAAAAAAQQQTRNVVTRGSTTPYERRHKQNPAQPPPPPPPMQLHSPISYHHNENGFNETGGGFSTPLGSPAGVVATSTPSKGQRGTGQPQQVSSPSSSTPGTPLQRGLQIKRSEEAPVTLSGWLFKQGSDGLMLWKKRWFVLSEYCLFYYKSPESEDKTLGSILLPSYKISPVTDLNKKHAFKAEHANMRTYFFAAETKESMLQWMNALSLASILQLEQPKTSTANTTLTSSPMPPPQTPSSARASSGASSAAASRYQHNHPPAVHQMHSASGDAYMYHARQQNQQQQDEVAVLMHPITRQPLYANAPPKPRRLNSTSGNSHGGRDDDERMSSDNGGFTDFSESDHQGGRNVPPNHHRLPPEQGMARATYHRPRGANQAFVLQEDQQFYPNQQQHPVRQPHRLPQEGRTPEAYARARMVANQMHMKGHPGSGPHHPQQQQYQPQQQQQQVDQFEGHPQYRHSVVAGPDYNNDNEVMFHYQNMQHQQQQMGYMGGQPQMMAPAATPVWGPAMPPQQHRPRPHSADFLDREDAMMAAAAGVASQMPQQIGQHLQQPSQQSNTPHRYARFNKSKPQPPRPKSSIEQRMVTSQPDGGGHDQWADELERMRRLSLRQQQEQVDNRHLYLPPDQQHQWMLQQQQHQMQHDNNGNTDDQELEQYFPTPSPRKPFVPSSYMNVPKKSASRGPSRLQQPSAATPHDTYNQIRMGSMTPNRFTAAEMMRAKRQAQQQHGGPVDLEPDDVEGHEFRRSASARLHRNKRNNQEMFQDNNDDFKRKEQREESMKRLLEWKQRMLQSPLTRKSSRNPSRTQTPTNSNSPVPTGLGQGFEVRKTSGLAIDSSRKASVNESSGGGAPSSSRRVSRKGSGASRSSRSRSSPRIAGSRATQESSSDEEGVVNTSDTVRQRRKSSRSSSQQPTPSSRKQSTSATDQELHDYMNVDFRQNTPPQATTSGDNTTPSNLWQRKTIGPDAWYSDDFDYGKAVMQEDPYFSSQQYNQLLTSQLNKQSSQNSVLVVQPPAGFLSSPQAVEPVSSGYESMKQQQPRSSKAKAEVMSRSKTWSGDQFSEVGQIHMLEKSNDKQVLLRVHTDKALPPVSSAARSKRKSTGDAAKVPWSPIKSTSSVREIRNSFEQKTDETTTSTKEENVVMNSRESREMTRTAFLFGAKAAQESEKQKKSLEKVKDFALSDSNDSYVEPEPEPEERKRSVKELLSDFEKKSKEELQEEEDTPPGQGGARRRVFSDTETMMYESSESEQSFVFTGKSAAAAAASVAANQDTTSDTSSFVYDAKPEETKLEVAEEEEGVDEEDYLDMNVKVGPAVSETQVMERLKQQQPRKPPVNQSLILEHLKKEQEAVGLKLLQTAESGAKPTPSRSMIAEHLKMEQEAVAKRLNQKGKAAKPEDDSYIEMQTPGGAAKLGPESPRYCEIEEADEPPPPQSGGGDKHYEYLYKATSLCSSEATAASIASSSQHHYHQRHSSAASAAASISNYESVYQEISEDEVQVFGSQRRLPDIVGDSDPPPPPQEQQQQQADQKSLFNASDTFVPASFFLNRAPAASKKPLTGSGGLVLKHPTILSKPANLAYQSVYDNDAETNESSSSGGGEVRNQMAAAAVAAAAQQSGKVPYYVSDVDHSTLERAKAVEALEDEMKLLDAKTDELLLSNAYKKRRAQTPDSFLLEQHQQQNSISHLCQPSEDGVRIRSKSLEGLLGDGPGAPRDSVQVNLGPRGRPPPPPPPLGEVTSPSRPNVEDIQRAMALMQQQQDCSLEVDDDDSHWRESLRRASHRQRSLLDNSFTTSNSHFSGNGNSSSSVPFLDQSLPSKANVINSVPPKFRISAENAGLLGRRQFTTHEEKEQENGSILLHLQTSDSDEPSEIVSRHHHKKRNSKKDNEQNNQQPRRRKQSLSDISAQDLLEKSHEELVLMLIHLRRQTTALTEAIEGSKAELGHMEKALSSYGGKSEVALMMLGSSGSNNSNGNDSSLEHHKRMMDDLSDHLKELEEKRAKTLPMISLVDNMVKLGSLYKGPQNAPLSHRIRNIPSSQEQQPISRHHHLVSNGGGHQSSSQQASKQQRRKDIQALLEELCRIEQTVLVEEVTYHRLKNKYQNVLQQSVEVVKESLKDDSQKKISAEEYVRQKKLWEDELEQVRNKLNASQRQLEENCAAHGKWEHDLLILRQSLQASATRDMQYGLGQSAETLSIEAELSQVQQKASKLHGKRNVILSEIQALTEKEDFLSRSPAVSYGYHEPPPPTATAAPPVVEPPSLTTLGDISQADDRVKKFYGIPTKQQQQSQVIHDNNNKRSVRMVKRDSKERTVTATSSGGSSIRNSSSSCEDLNSENNQGSSSQQNGGGGGGMFESNSDQSDGSSFGRPVGQKQETVMPPPPPPPPPPMPKANFVLGEYSQTRNVTRKSASTPERPGSSLSAHERLFGSASSSPSKESSPPFVGGGGARRKTGSVGSGTTSGPSSSEHSSIASPVFKSAAAKAIIEEVGSKHPLPRSQGRKVKKRSFTITGSQPAAVLEAIQNHNSKEAAGGARSRDDLDMEQALKGAETDSSGNVSPPDVIRSAINKDDSGREIVKGTPAGASTKIIDNLFGVPDKIVIPERYIPETDMDHQTPEEREVRLKKADSIRRMLADQGHHGEPGGAASGSGGASSLDSSEAKQQLDEEKKHRERLLALNQVIAQQVLEKSRMVAVRALADKKFPDDSIRHDSLLHRAAVKSTSYTSNYSFDESPNITIMSNTDLTADLPMYQTRENYLE